MTEAALLAAIRDDPDDDLPRLAYADWCEEQGRAERGEFIRLQIELSRGVSDRGRALELSRRQRVLLERNRDDWLGPLGAIVREPRFERGFITGVRMSVPDLLQDGQAVLAAHPITRACLYSVNGKEGELAGCPHLSAFRSLNLGGEQNGDALAAALARSKHLGKLGTLHLAEMRLSCEGVAALVASSGLPELTNLDLAGNGFRDNGVERLSRLLSLPRLRRLDLSRNLLGADSVRYLVASDRLNSLTVLRLSQNQLAPVEIEALVRSPRLAHLQVLDVTGCTRVGLDQLAALRRELGPRLVC